MVPPPAGIRFVAPPFESVVARDTADLYIQVALHYLLCSSLVVRLDIDGNTYDITSIVWDELPEYRRGTVAPAVETEAATSFVMNVQGLTRGWHVFIVKVGGDGCGEPAVGEVVEDTLRLQVLY